MNKNYIIGIVAVIAIGAGVYFLTKDSVVPSVSVDDQKDNTSTVTIKEVVAPKDGWLVIQTNEDGVPGPVLGYVAIKAGVSQNVKVKIDTAKATSTLHAMIHEDNGTKGKFDFPDNDMPIMYKMDMVTKIFKLN